MKLTKESLAMKVDKLFGKDQASEDAHTINCHLCSNCTYACSGSYFCEVSNDLVIIDWTPSDNYFSCKGKDFVKL